MIFVDTVAWLYLFDEQQDGEEARQARDFIKTLNQALCTSDMVISETHKWLIHHGRPASKSFKALKALAQQEITHIIPIEQADRTKAIELVKKYTDQKLSYTDAVSVALMRRLKIKQIFSFDMHFRLFPEIEAVPAAFY
jgi:uncharacterized protein